MDYTEQFIRLNCSLMSDYKMMKLNAEMKCMGIGLYIQMILFLRRQQEYKHDFNELDLLAEQWGATVENLQHLIKDFNLFVITEDGYFRCLYLDEVMGYQNKLSEQRAAAGSKGGRSSKKKTAQIAEKVITSTVLFVLGISIGSNSLIINNLGRFGWQAAILATLSILGSMLASFLVFHLFFKKGGKQ
jgi:hypothetical protein